MTARPSICLIAPEFIGPFPNGGVGTACYWEAQTLAAAGFEVTVLYTGPTERADAEHWERTYTAGPLRYVDLWRWAQQHPASTIIEQPCGEAATAELVLAFLRHAAVRQRPFDLLLFQEFLGHGSRALQARRAGDPALATSRTAVTLHSCRQWIYEGMRRLPSAHADLCVDFLERESARLADAVAAPSRHMSAWAAEHWRMRTPATVVPYCYDATLERPATRVEHAGPFTHLIFFGRLETRKGLHLFCRALAEQPEARAGITRVTFLGKVSSVEGHPSDCYIREMLGGIPGLDIQIVSNLGSLEALAWLDQQQHALVVAPSIVDNLPYALIELWSRRLPLLSTRVGGIPEIVGESNHHLLAAPSAGDLGRLLRGVLQRGSLTIDYAGGYSISGSNAQHVEWARSLLGTPARAPRTATRLKSVVLVDATEDALPALEERFVAADPSATGLRFHTWGSWRAADDTAAAIFAASHVTPAAGMTARLNQALSDVRVEAATSYHNTERGNDAATIAPLGPSLEAGWTGNVFGGPCVAARGTAVEAIRQSAGDQFAFWPAYAAIACAGLELALVPEALYRAERVAEPTDALPAVAAIYRRSAGDRLDLGWVLKFAGQQQPGTSAWGSDLGRALYERFAAMPDEGVEAFSTLKWRATIDPRVADMRRLRERLLTIAADWAKRCPRVFVYGAGQHTKLVLTLAPELGAFIAGFIDRRQIREFLGKPCIRPEDLTPSMADVVLYSSREFEREMYGRLAQVDVEHVLLYSESPAAPSNDTSSRLRRRFGHAGAAIEELRAMYRVPQWAEGRCGDGDVEFLAELVAAVNPRLVIELGVASGASSAALLFAMDRLPGDADRVLWSGDICRTCYFDPARPTGAAVHEMYPAHRTAWVLNTDCDARRARGELPPASADLCLIDANHYHPWPLLDLLHLSTLLRPGAWVALHDIELPRIHPQFQVHGAQWLFEAWPFNKVHGVDRSVNIGAVQLPEDLRAIVPVALELLERPWEHLPTTWDVGLPEIFDEISHAIAPRLAGLAASPLVGLGCAS